MPTKCGTSELYRLADSRSTLECAPRSITWEEKSGPSEPFHSQKHRWTLRAHAFNCDRMLAGERADFLYKRPQSANKISVCFRQWIPPHHLSGFVRTPTYFRRNSQMWRIIISLETPRKKHANFCRYWASCLTQEWRQIFGENSCRTKSPIAELSIPVPERKWLFVLSGDQHTSDSATRKWGCRMSAAYAQHHPLHTSQLQ